MQEKKDSRNKDEKNNYNLVAETDILFSQILDDLQMAEDHTREESIEDQLKKSKERILRLKDLSMKLRTVNELIESDEKPAFKRRALLIPTISDAPAFVTDNLLDEIKSLNRQLSELTQENNKLKNFIDSDLRGRDEERKKQLLPIDIYLDTDVPVDIYLVYQSILDFIETIGFERLMEFEAIKGSWIKRMIGLSKEVITSQEVRDRLKEAEYGIEVNAILKQQSEIDKNQSEALMNILKSVENIPNAAIRIGSLLVVKLTNVEGEVNVQVRSLSIKELYVLNKKPELLHKPSQILSALSREISGTTTDQL